MVWDPEYKKKLKARVKKYKGPKTYTTPEGKRRKYEAFKDYLKSFRETRNYTQEQSDEVVKLIKNTDLNQTEIAAEVNKNPAFKNLDEMTPDGVRHHARNYFKIRRRARASKAYRRRFPFATRKGEKIKSILKNKKLKASLIKDWEDKLPKQEILDKYSKGVGKKLLPPGITVLGKETLNEAYEAWGLEREGGELHKLDVTSEASQAKAKKIRKYYGNPKLSRIVARKKIGMTENQVQKFTKRWNETYPDDPLFTSRREDGVQYEGAGPEREVFKKKTKDLQKFQTLLNRHSKNPPRSGTLELAKLVRLSGLTPVTFQRNIEVLRNIYKGKKRPGFIINPNLKKNIGKFPLYAGLTRDILLAAGYSTKQLDKLERAQTAIYKLGKPGFRNQLEHAVPESAIRYLQENGWISKGEYNDLVARVKPVTSYLNHWKKQYDLKLFLNLKKYLESEMSQADLNLYNKTQNHIIGEAQRVSGGYKIGKIVADLDGNIDVRSPDKLFTEKVKGVGPTSRALIDYYKNLKYHNILEQKFRNNPNLQVNLINAEGNLSKEGAFGTLKGYLGKEKMPRYDTTITKEIEKLSSHGDFMDYFKTNPDSPLLKGIQRSTRPLMPQSLLNKVKGKGGRLGFLTAAAFMLANATTKEKGLTTEEVKERGGPGFVDREQVTEVAEPQDTMKYNPYTGEFENTMTGDPETQAGVLNWIADNPTTAGFAAMPALFGTGLGASALNAKKIAGYLTSWKAIIPALAVPHVMHEAKIGKDVGEIALNPLNALWALGIRSPGQMKDVKAYYDTMLAKGRRGLDMTTLKSLKNVQGWKNLPSAMRTALMSPAATGTNLAMGKWGRKPFLAGVKALKNQATKQAAKQVGKAGLGYLARRAALTTAVAAVAPFAALPLGIGTGVLGLGYLGWQGYKEYKKGSEVIDSMRSKGKINEKTAEGYYDLLKRNIVPFGDQLLGGDNLEMFGDNLNPDQQLDLQKVMEDEIGSSLLEEQEDRATSRSDFFDTFSEGGRVGMRLGGGIDRRGFLKWLMGLGAAAVGAGSGLFKGAGTKVAKEAAKTAVKAEFPGIPGMPEWFPRLVAKIKTEGSLKSMADADYVEGDIYSIMVPIKKRIFDKLGKPTGEYKIEQTKVLMEHNPRSKDIDISWNVDDFDGTMTRRMRFSPGKTGYQRFNADPEFPTSTETLQVEVERPMFEYGNPDQSNPARDEFISMDIFEEEDQVVNWFKNWVKGTDDTKPKWTKDMEKNFETHVDTGENFGDATSQDDALDIFDVVGSRYEKAGGGEIARRPGAVAPLSGPEGIMSLSFSPKRVNVVGS